MHDGGRVAQLLMNGAASLASEIEAVAIIAAADALPKVKELPPRTVLVFRNEAERTRLAPMIELAQTTFDVPDVELDRLGQVTLASIIAISNRVLQRDDSAVLLTGPFGGLIDTMVVTAVGVEYEMFDSTDQPDIDEHIRRAVFHRVLSVALGLGQHGREGRRTGALIVVGDQARVLEESNQMILNPFKGYPDKQRNILDDAVIETVREFSALDGAFIIRGNGVIETAGAHLKTGPVTDVPAGLGARHAAAAGITAITKSIAFTVSQTDGTVRVWRAGRMVATFETPRNRN